MIDVKFQIKIYNLNEFIFDQPFQWNFKNCLKALGTKKPRSMPFGGIC